VWEANVTSLPRLVRELEFKVVKEDWFVYKLADDSILKVKPVLVRVFETDQVGPDGKRILLFVGQNVVAVRSPEKLKRTPTLPLPPPTEALKMDKEEVEITETLYDPGWNVYELENGEKVKMKIVITHVYRVKGLYTETGDPYYVIQSATVAGSSPEREAGSFPMTDPFASFRYMPNFSSLFTRDNPSLQHSPSPALVWTYPPGLKLLPVETRLREVPVEDLVKFLDANEALVESELKELLRSYGIPEEYAGKAEAMVKDYVRSELEKRGLPTEDWILKPLYKLLVHLAYVMLHA
jgi:hypothetical protein